MTFADSIVRVNVCIGEGTVHVRAKTAMPDFPGTVVSFAWVRPGPLQEPAARGWLGLFAGTPCVAMAVFQSRNRSLGELTAGERDWLLVYQVWLALIRAYIFCIMLPVIANGAVRLAACSQPM